MRAFGAILQHPGALVMSASALVGRFPIAMLGLALTLLVVAETGLYARAGAVAALLTVGGAVGGPLSSRVADRHGQDRVLPPLVALHVVAVAALTAAVLRGWPTALWLGLAFAAGLVLPNFGAMVRPLGQPRPRRRPAHHGIRPRGDARRAHLRPGPGGGHRAGRRRHALVGRAGLRAAHRRRGAGLRGAAAHPAGARTGRGAGLG
jgi:hypothetical protein